MVRLYLPNTGGAGLIPGWGPKIPHAPPPKSQNINNRSNAVAHSIKALKIAHVKKKKKSRKNWL